MMCKQVLFDDFDSMLLSSLEKTIKTLNFGKLFVREGGYVKRVKELNSENLNLIFSAQF